MGDAGRATAAEPFPENLRRHARGVAAAKRAGLSGHPRCALQRETERSINDTTAQPTSHVKGKEYPLLVPKVDKDGNETAGIRAVNLQVPLATHAGWNLRAKGFMEDELCYLNGQYIPFAKTKEEREKSGDPRLSLEERYKDQADYVQQVSRAARALVDERFLLPEDAERLIAEAAKARIFADTKQ